MHIRLFKEVNWLQVWRVCSDALVSRPGFLPVVALS